MNKKVVTVFGSSIPVFGEEQYEWAYKLGEIFAKNNLDLCTGGNLGIMEAVSKAAKENGARTIGITLKGSFGNHNQFISDHISCDTLFERITKLINKGDAYVVLQGGTGTLLELSAVWELMNKKILTKKPFACHGYMWKGIIETIEEQLSKENRKTGLIKYCSDIEECADFIVQKLNMVN
ncbi:MAG: LOG family protein [Bacteroidota bacterium]|nr:LOG family protein [Bacteroidota bacterium]